jgi:hypothetical protein
LRRWAASGATPEESALARLSVLSAAGVANVGLAVEAGASGTAVTCLLLVALGHYLSWRGRHRRRTRRGQVFLGFLLLGCIAYLVADLAFGVFGGALPQAKFAMLAQAVTAFDLKSRRNLFTHIWHSAVILYIGALFAWTPAYVVFVLAWALAFFAFLHFTRGKMGAEPAAGRLLASLSASARPVTPWIACWLGLGVIVFVGLPRFAGRPTAVPLLLSIPLPEQAAPEILPAVLPLVGTQPGPGSEQSINLRVRGRLGDEVMFRVRAPAASYWRAYTLEQYRGQSWVRVSRPSRAIPPITSDLPIADEPIGEGADLPQTFYIEHPLPAEVIASYPLRELYFPARQLILASTGTIRAPFGLRRGVNYSAVSIVRDFSPQALRSADPLAGADPSSPDLALPSTLPARVKRLEDDLVAGQSLEYDRVASITQYLRSHYRYSLNTPRLPAAADAVDQFLFVDRVGFCEQFASALAVLLRSEGIPSRLAVGYATGDHDTFTGSFTVRARDAHAWVEVLFPGVGWMPFDASPGFAAQPAAQKPSRWLLSDFSPQVALAGLGAGGRQAAVLGSGMLVLTGVVVVAVLALRHRRLPPALRAYQRSQRWLRMGGLPARTPWQTPAEHLAWLRTFSAPAAGALAPLTSRVEAAAYAGAEVRRAGTSLGVLAEALRHRFRGRRVQQ